ncbi:MAG TPA: ATP-binding cassette domain-containing protein [Verrucomicrobiota bacterium]|nr:ATP-binding cassette domain-containing protein [Verrucomicrobiota bacterium]
MNPPGETVITVKDLKMGYGEKVLMECLNFEVKRGEVFIILGGSGCGKSTLLKHMIGLYPPMAGQILYGNEDIATSEGDERLAILRKFGVMYQSGALFGSMTVLENVKLPLDEFTSLPDRAKELIAMAKLKLVSMDAAANKMPADLSGGMQKRAAIARAMALDPGILFLDEPSAGLDPITSSGLDDLINDLAANLGITFVVVTHELPSIFKIADRVIMLDVKTRGIIGEGSPEELRDHSPNPWVRQFFNREADAPKETPAAAKT